jgi:crossover junction endodeoxyribonuclease RuvC
MTDTEHKPLHVVGIDPGAKGGIACIYRPPARSPRILWGIRMPLTHHAKKPAVDAAQLTNLLAPNPVVDRVIVIEQVHAMPRQGVSSSFQFGRNFGALEAIALASGLPTHFVTPNTWKKSLNLSSDKRASIDKARQLFGGEADQFIKHLADDGIAEAALMAYYWASKN